MEQKELIQQNNKSIYNKYKSQDPPIIAMSMFFDSLLMMMQKQKISQYLINKITTLKLNPSHQLQNFIVQVISSDHISDGTTNFFTKFKKIAKKGSIIRLLEWSLDLQTFQIILNDWQYLGGAGYNINQGKPWDIQKIKLMTSSSIISKDFIVIHNPTHSKVNQKITNNPLFLGNSHTHDQNTRLAVEKEKIFNIKFLTFSGSNKSKKQFSGNGSKENQRIRERTNNQQNIQELKMKQWQKKEQQGEKEQDKTNMHRKQVLQMQQQLSDKHEGVIDRRQNQSEEQASSIDQQKQMKVSELDQNIENKQVKGELNVQIFKYSQNQVEKASKIKISENQAASNLSIRTLLNKKSDTVENKVTNKIGSSHEQVNMQMIEISSISQKKEKQKKEWPASQKDRQLVFNKQQISRLLGKND